MSEWMEISPVTIWAMRICFGIGVFVMIKESFWFSNFWEKFIKKQYKRIDNESV